MPVTDEMELLDRCKALLALADWLKAKLERSGDLEQGCSGFTPVTRNARIIISKIEMRGKKTRENKMGAVGVAEQAIEPLP